MKRSIINKVIGVFAPGVALRQLQAQIVLDKIESGSRKYDGASKGRNTNDWIGISSSSNVEVQTDIVTLRNRSRELSRNNGYAKNYSRVMANNIVGIGVTPKPIIVGRSGKSEKVKEIWDLWASNIKCDYDARYNFYGLQRLIIKTVIVSGECLIIKRLATSKYEVPLRLQIIEADFIDHGKFSMLNDYGGITWYGIEFNKQGERVGYWLWNRHPGEFATVSKRIDAKFVIHVYDPERPGQHRGVPELHAGMVALKDLGDYEYAERIRAKTAATQVGAITQDLSLEGDGDLASSFTTMEPGTFHKLKPGESITFNTPPTNTGYSEYTKNNLHSIAAAGGTTYESLTSDLSNVNFSSGRMGWLEFQRNIQHFQWNVLVPALDEMFIWFVEAAQVAALLPMQGKFKVEWTMPRREMIDPVKEGKALTEMVRGKFKTWAEAVREQGDDPDKVFEDLKEEFDKFKAAGLTPSSMPEFDPERKNLDPSLNGTALK